VKAPSELASSLLAAFDFGLPRFSSDPVSLRTSSISDRLSRFFLITFYNSFILNASSRCRVSQPGAHCHATQEAKYETAHGDMVHHSGSCRQPSSHGNGRRSGKYQTLGGQGIARRTSRSHRHISASAKGRSSARSTERRRNPWNEQECAGH